MSHNEFKKIREPIEPQEVSPMKQEMTVLGIDLAKHVFHAVGMDNTGKIVFRKRLSRHDLMPFIAKLPMVLIGLEACGGAHYWARRFRASGHEVKLMAPQFVKPYVKSNKNDSRDAEAIAEAVTRPTMRFVPTKDVDQQDIQALHRVRERGELPERHASWESRLRDVANMTEVIIAKQRMGPIGVEKLHFNPELTRFTDLAM